MSFFTKILNLVGQITDKFGPVIEIFAKIDVTKLNEADRYAFGVAAAEFRQAGAAFNRFADILDATKDGGISPEEYAELVKGLKDIVDELDDIPPAVKALF